MQDVIIIGGGLAGLISGLELARKGFAVTLIERKVYPFHKVCGEYVSNEVKGYITSLGLDLDALGVARISQFQFTSPSGRSLEAPLDLGGFGISRYTLDYELFRLGQEAGITFILGKTAEAVEVGPLGGEVTLNDGRILQARVLIGAFGKRTRLDKTLGRAFMTQPSPYIGVKYHIRTDFPKDRIALHNFQDGYCGVSAIEDDKYCLCYLTTRENLRQHGTISAMEAAILHRNPHLQAMYTNADFLYEKPEVINEISFAPKRAVENHMLMVGDTAGLITPLCGNGMAMAIHGAKVASELVTTFLQNKVSRPELEEQYQAAWQRLFARRLWVGRTVQRLFGDEWLSELAVTVFRTVKPALHGVMRQTHGAVIR